MKVMTVVGTRPEIIRLSLIVKRLDTLVDHVLVHTGQNYDYELNQVFFDELEVRPPNHYLGVDASSVANVMAGTLIGVERLIQAERPDALLVLGDTNSAVAAVIAKRMKVPVYHMEAGNRSFDENVPEEINRRMIDHVSDFNLVYTEHARRNLLAEGLHPRRIMLTGSPMREVIDHYSGGIESSSVLGRLGLDEQSYLLVSAHREENVDSVERLTTLLDSLTAMRDHLDCRVVVSTHPRTRKRIEALSSTAVRGLEFMSPFGFLDYCKLQTKALCVLSDSGTISEESAILGFPAVTIRDSMERPEALDAGTILMSGLGADDLIRNARLAIALRDEAPGERPAEYDIRDTSARTVKFVLSTVGRHHEWAGIRVRPNRSRG